MNYIFVVILMVILAGAIRFLVSRNEKLSNSKLAVYIKFIIYFIMMFILSYYVTDIYEGLIRVTLSVCFYGVMIYITNQKDDQVVINILIVVVLPIYFIFMLDATYYLLVMFSTLLLPVIIISGLMFVEFRELNKSNWKVAIAIVIGLAISSTFLPMANESLYVEDLAMKYAQEELGIEFDYIYASKGVRDEPIIINAFNSFDENKLTMVYRNGSIISSEMED